LQSDRGHSIKIEEIERTRDSIQVVSIERFNRFQNEQDSISKELEKTKKDLLDEQERNKKMKADFENRLKSIQGNYNRPGAGISIKGGNKSIDALMPYVYFIYTQKIEFISPEGERKIANENVGWTGSGFLLNDGRLVTARHVVEPWMFVQNETETTAIVMNLIVNNGGKVIVHFIAISSSDSFSFTNEVVCCDRSGDEFGATEDGLRYSAARGGNSDWAYVRTKRNDGLSFDSQASRKLPRGEELTILGFPLALGANSVNDIEPIWGYAITAKQGLDRGVILTTDTNFEHGNSGCPALVRDSSSGNYYVVGIVSAMAGRSTGFIVPISAIN